MKSRTRLLLLCAAVCLLASAGPVRSVESEPDEDIPTPYDPVNNNNNPSEPDGGPVSGSGGGGDTDDSWIGAQSGGDPQEPGVPGDEGGDGGDPVVDDGPAGGDDGDSSDGGGGEPDGGAGGWSDCVRGDDGMPVDEEGNPCPIPIIMPAPKPCACNKKYQPVCARDGKVYGNPCMAKCKEEKVKFFCNGHKNCKRDCQLAAGDCSVCNKVSLPVCGKSGKLRVNTCRAQCKKDKVRFVCGKRNNKSCSRACKAAKSL